MMSSSQRSQADLQQSSTIPQDVLDGDAFWLIVQEPVARRPASWNRNFANFDPRLIEEITCLYNENTTLRRPTKDGNGLDGLRRQ